MPCSKNNSHGEREKLVPLATLKKTIIDAAAPLEESVLEMSFESSQHLPGYPHGNGAGPG
jgi:hypothetical protein